MKKEYIEKIPAQKIKHNIIICDNPNCETVIIDNKIQMMNHFQAGDGKKLKDFCSQKCLKKYEKSI